MSDKIKPSEVSQVLLDQLKGISDDEKFDEVGTVLTVSDGVARIYGLRNVEASELLEFENGTMAIVMNLEEDNVGCVLLGTTSLLLSVSTTICSDVSSTRWDRLSTARETLI